MSDLQRTLRELHLELGAAQRLDPQDRVLLESTVRDIQRALGESDDGSAGDAVVDGEPGSGALAAAVVRLEAEHPALATAVRALMDSLAKAGI